MLQQLIDKKDNFELVRDQIAIILATEVTNQKSLATAGGKNPALWDFKVYLERSNPLDNYSSESDLTPVVAVSYYNSVFDGTKGDGTETQACTAQFNIDCYAIGKSGDSGTGQVNGDQVANESVQRIVRLVRNILEAPEYRWLNLRGTVGKRKISKIEVQQASKQERDVTLNVAVATLALTVDMIETSPQYIGQPLEYTNVNIDANGLVQIDFNYTS